MQIHKFNLRDIKNDDLIIIIGGKNSGKSLLIKDILYFFSNHDYDVLLNQLSTQNIKINDYDKIKKFNINKLNFKPYGLIFSPDKKLIYNNIIPDILLELEITEKIIKKIYKKYKLYKKRIEEGINEDTTSFLVFDDCIFNKNKYYIKYLNKIVQLKKLLNIFLIISVQDYSFINDFQLNQNINYIFLSNFINNENKLKNIYKYYCNFIPSYDIFLNIFKQSNLNDYEFLVFKTNSNEEWKKRIFWYKSVYLDNFKLCSDKYWIKNNKIIEERLDSKKRYKSYYYKKMDLITKIEDSQILNKKQKKDFNKYLKKMYKKIKNKK